MNIEEKLKKISILIEKKCDEIKEMLIKKNESYGGAVFDPIKVFSDCGRYEQVNVRIDDKLSRIIRGKKYGEDNVKDLTGYLILKLILKELEDEKE